MCLQKMRLEIPGETSSLMNLPQPSFQAQTKGERESSTGTWFVFPTFLSSSLFPLLPIQALGQVRGSSVSCTSIFSLDFFPPEPGKKNGTAGSMHNESSPGSHEGPFWLSKSMLASPKRCSYELWYVSTGALHVIVSYLEQGVILLLCACTVFSTMGP